MKYIIKIFMVAIVAIICLTACDKEYYAHYIVEGRVIDKITKEPVIDIMVSFAKYDIIHPPRNVQKIQKTSPIGHEGWSDENGEFNVLSRRLDKYYPSLLYIYGYYGGYKDTTILVDFSNISLSGTPSGKYKGDYVLNIGDIELEKIE